MKPSVMLPSEIDAGLRSIEAATERLATAVELKDDGAIHEALGERGRLIEELRPRIAGFDGAATNEALQSRTRTLIDHGKKALEALEKSRAATAAVLARMAKESVALRAYGNDLPTASSLDRSG